MSLICPRCGSHTTKLEANPRQCTKCPWVETSLPTVVPMKAAVPEPKVNRGGEIPAKKNKDTWGACVGCQGYGTVKHAAGHDVVCKVCAGTGTVNPNAEKMALEEVIKKHPTGIIEVQPMPRSPALDHIFAPPTTGAKLMDEIATVQQTEGTAAALMLDVRRAREAAKRGDTKEFDTLKALEKAEMDALREHVVKAALQNTDDHFSSKPLRCNRCDVFPLTFGIKAGDPCDARRTSFCAGTFHPGGIESRLFLERLMADQRPLQEQLASLPHKPIAAEVTAAVDSRERWAHTEAQVMEWDLARREKPLSEQEIASGHFDPAKHGRQACSACDGTGDARDQTGWPPQEALEGKDPSAGTPAGGESTTEPVASPGTPPQWDLHMTGKEHKDAIGLIMKQHLKSAETKVPVPEAKLPEKRPCRTCGGFGFIRWVDSYAGSTTWIVISKWTNRFAFCLDEANADKVMEILAAETGGLFYKRPTTHLDFETYRPFPGDEFEGYVPYMNSKVGEDGIRTTCPRKALVRIQKSSIPSMLTACQQALDKIKAENPDDPLFRFRYPEDIQCQRMVEGQSGS